MNKVFVPPEKFLDYLPKESTSISFLMAKIDDQDTDVAIDLGMYPNPYKALNKNNFITLLFDEVCIYEDESANEFYEPKDTNCKPIKAFRKATINTNRISEIFEYPDTYSYHVYIIGLNTYKRLRRQYGQHI